MTVGTWGATVGGMEQWQLALWFWVTVYGALLWFKPTRKIGLALLVLPLLLVWLLRLSEPPFDT